MSSRRQGDMSGMQYHEMPDTEEYSLSGIYQNNFPHIPNHGFSGYSFDNYLDPPEVRCVDQQSDESGFDRAPSNDPSASLDPFLNTDHRSSRRFSQLTSDSYVDADQGSNFDEYQGITEHQPFVDSGLTGIGTWDSIQASIPYPQQLHPTMAEQNVIPFPYQMAYASGQNQNNPEQVQSGPNHKFTPTCTNCTSAFVEGYYASCSYCDRDPDTMEIKKLAEFLQTTEAAVREGLGKAPHPFPEFQITDENRHICHASVREDWHNRYLSGRRGPPCRTLSGENHEHGYPCIICGEKFKNIPDLIRHMNCAYPHKWWWCPACNTVFHRKDNLTYHLQGRDHAFSKEDAKYLARRLLFEEFDPEIDEICLFCGVHLTSARIYFDKHIPDHLNPKGGLPSPSPEQLERYIQEQRRNYSPVVKSSPSTDKNDPRYYRRDGDDNGASGGGSSFPTAGAGSYYGSSQVQGNTGTSNSGNYHSYQGSQRQAAGELQMTKDTAVADWSTKPTADVTTSKSQFYPFDKKLLLSISLFKLSIINVLRMPSGVPEVFSSLRTTNKSHKQMQLEKRSKGITQCGVYAITSDGCHLTPHKESVWQASTDFYNEGDGQGLVQSLECLTLRSERIKRKHQQLVLWYSTAPLFSDYWTP